MGHCPSMAIGTFQERKGNESSPALSPINPEGPRTQPSSRPRRPAGRVVGPVAVEPDHAPLDPPVGADHAGVLLDRIVDRVPAAVGDLDAAAAEAPRDALRRPGAERGLADILETDDGEIAGPEGAFLLV